MNVKLIVIFTCIFSIASNTASRKTVVDITKFKLPVALLPNFSQCSNSLFRCDYGACVGRHLVCNGAFDCADGSDEQLDLCKSVECRVPFATPNTVYYTAGCDGQCGGIPAEDGAVLHYVCANNSSDANLSVVKPKCRNGSWRPTIPSCTGSNDGAPVTGGTSAGTPSIGGNGGAVPGTVTANVKPATTSGTVTSNGAGTGGTGTPVAESKPKEASGEGSAQAAGNPSTNGKPDSAGKPSTNGKPDSAVKPIQMKE